MIEIWVFEMVFELGDRDRFFEMVFDLSDRDRVFEMVLNRLTQNPTENPISITQVENHLENSTLSYIFPINFSFKKKIKVEKRNFYFINKRKVPTFIL